MDSKVPVSLSPAFLFCIALSLLMVPIKWLFAWLFAALVHELFHYVALLLCKCAVLSVGVGVGGAKINTEPLSEMQECFCALAGPLGGALLLLLAPVAPIVAVCAFLQSAYNLLPIYPMDGGRALFSLIRKILKPSAAERFIQIWTLTITLCVAGVSLLATFRWMLGPLPVAAAVILVMRNKKSLANRAGNEYNVCSYGSDVKRQKLRMRYSCDDATGADIAYRTETGAIYGRRV